MKLNTKHFDLSHILGYIDKQMMQPDEPKDVQAQASSTLLESGIDFSAKVTTLNLYIGGNNLSTKQLEITKQTMLYTLSESALCLNTRVLKDRIIAIFNTPLKTDLESLIEMTAKMISMKDVLQFKFSLDEEIQMKIALNYGVVDFMFYKEMNAQSSQYEWFGEGIDGAYFMLKNQSKTGLYVDEVIYNNLKEEYQNFFEREVFMGSLCWRANIVNKSIIGWIKDNSK